MSSPTSTQAITVALAVSVAGGLARLILGDLLKAKWPRLYGWLTDYRGQVARWTSLAVIMFAIAGFCVFLALTMKSGPSGNRVVLLGFAVVALSVVLLAVVQSSRVLRAARLEGRR